MAAPAYNAASTGTTDTAGAWTHTGPVPSAIGRILIVQVVQDGVTTGANQPTISSVTNAEDLAGTDNVLTFIGAFPIGSPTSAYQHLWIGRSTSTSAMVITGANVGGDDVYIRVYAFQDVSVGTTLATVIENGTAGATVNGVGTGTTVSDTGVTTLGPDRMACNFVGLNDDVAIDAFAGATGGSWVEFVAEYADASGTDACLQFQAAAMPTAGTVNGGSDAIVTAGWGVVGFALIGTTPSGTPISGTDSGSGTDSASIGILVNERAKFTDDFNRANENPIKAPWSDTSQLASNAVQGLVDYGGAALDFWATDVEISGSWISGGTRYYGLQVRKTGIAGQNVELQVVKDSQNVKIFEDGVQLGVTVAATVNFGDTFILEVIGSTAKGYRIPSGGGTRTEIISRTLTTRLGPGAVGFYQREVAQVFDNFSFSNLASVTTETAALTVAVVGTDRSAPTAFSTTPVLDNFNRADESPLVGGWTSVSNLAVSSNQLAPLATSNVYAFWGTAMPGPDVEAYLEIATKPVTGADSAVFARYTWTDTTGYRVRHTVAAGTDTIILDRTLGNIVLGSWSLELAAGDAIGIRCVGNVIEAWARVSGIWQLLGSVTDSTVAGTAPNTSLVFQHFPNASTVARWDNFGGGVLPSAVIESATATVPSTPISGTDAGTGTDTGIVTVPISATDTGSGLDFSALSRSVTDSGTGTDTATLTVRITIQDQAFGSSPVLDDFNRANENPVTGWTEQSGDGAIISNQLGIGSAVNTTLLWPTSMPGTDVEAWFTLTAVPVSNQVGIRVRRNPGVHNGYVLRAIDGAPDFITLEDPFGVEIGAYSGASFASGDQFGLQCVGSIIRAWYMPVSTGIWVNVLTRVDTQVDGTGAANKIGVNFGAGSGGLIDFFGGGITVAGSVENGTVTVPISASDSGTGSDASAINRGLLDSGTGSDAISAFTRSVTDSGTGTDTASVITAGVIGEWLLNESPAIHGTSIADSSGNGNTGTLSTGDGSTDKSVAGKIGGGISFDGTNDYVGVNTSVFNSIGAGDFTISAWVRNTDQTTRDAIVVKDDVDSSPGRTMFFLLNCDISGTNQPGMVLGAIFSSDSTYYAVYTAAAAVSEDSWCHVVWRRSSGVHSIWINGVSASVSPTGPGSAGLTVQSSVTQFQIGARQWPTNREFFAGDLDHIAVYNRALSNTEIEEAAAAGGVTKSGTDTGSGTDVISALVRQVPESGSASDASSLAAALSNLDSGTSTEVSKIDIALSDSGTSTENSAISLRLTDSGSGSETHKLVILVTDSGTSVEVSRIGIALSDTGAGTDVIPTLARQVADSGSALDESILIAGNERVGTDSGSGVDNATVVAVLSNTDTGAGTENQRISLTFADTGTGVEITGLARQVFDTGTGIDTAIVSTLNQKAGTDSGTTVESVILTVTVTGSDTGTGVDVFLRISQTLTDTGSGTDTGSLTAGYLLTDTLTGLDEGFLLIPISVSDFGTGSDDSLLSIETTVPEFHGSVLVSANGSRAEALTTRPAAKMTSVSMGNGNTLLKALEPGSELATTRGRSKMKKAN